MRKFCDFVHDVRIKTGIVLREFCPRNDLDVGYISKLERGVVAPVPDDKEFLDKYAKALQLNEEEKKEFYEIAERDKGKIYHEVNVGAALAGLLLHSKLQGKELSREQIEKFAEEVKHT